MYNLDKDWNKYGGMGMAAWDCKQNEDSCRSWTRVRTRITEQWTTIDRNDTEYGIKYGIYIT